ncbi:uncharacterized protein ACLA_015610 [Aspergillus clavatus NRRL 1]|uniref:Mitochondrial ATPase expression-domain-containing protein n=1 Tax=Aspergillus clavatus (strain ATCC 1007 / CBS 513.65 / DSM 816 / NCTC 3887 / NRRL 1 / QM 1276 / 107) TaxID=344612 RepID=A1CBK1_ASPCL|nr:uncharacterized protein ACLA_015610 [Aspergillus clavatus NRRL 1]EAW13119.1 conserved hypothetical protein [Aspergillus clavatus NRRL 1]
MLRYIIGRYGRSDGSSRLVGSASGSTPAAKLLQRRSLASHPHSFAPNDVEEEHHHHHHHGKQQQQQSSQSPRRDNGHQYSQFHAIRSVQSSVGVLEGPNQAPRTPIKNLNALKNAFFAIVRDGQPDQVMKALLDPQFETVVGELPESTFVEVFCLLSPAYFVDPFRGIYRPIHPFAVELKGYRALEAIFDEFACNLASIIATRRAAGHTLGLAEYAHLLDCARSIGDALMADHVWHAMTEDGVVPDVRCYNYYMEAKVWDMAYTGREKYHLRMTPYAYRKRRFYSPNVGWNGFRTAERSVRQEVLQIFNEMMEEGTSGDEATFVNVMLASARVGHVTGIKNILKTVWNVDVDALVAGQGDPTGLPSAMDYDRSSPMYPTSRLLFAIAHAFGNNNDIAGALRAIDFISTSYKIPVPEEVWLELLERSFVLSRPRFGFDADRNAKGKVPYEFLSTLVQTMTAEPFLVRPTIEMYHIQAKIAWDQAKLSDFKQHMESAYTLLEETRRKRRVARSIIQKYLGPPPSSTRTRKPSINHTLLQSRAFAEAVHAYDILRMRTAQQTILVERLARLLLIRRRWVGRDNPAWERHLLPRALEEWRDFLPNSIVYSTRGGKIQLHGGTHWGQRLLNTHQRIPLRRPTVDNGLVLERGARELDDDFVWAQYPAELRSLDLPAVQRLFWGVEERIVNTPRTVVAEEAVGPDAVGSRASDAAHVAELPGSKKPVENGGWRDGDETVDPASGDWIVA